MQIRSVVLAVESGPVLMTPNPALRKARSMSKSNSNTNEPTAGNHANGSTELEECTVCCAVGLPERIQDHDCNDFLDHKEVAAP